MKLIPFYLLVNFFLFACGNNTKTKKLTTNEVKQNVAKILNTELPNSSKNIEFARFRAFTAIYYMKFDIYENELKILLLSSEVLPDSIKKRDDKFPIKDSTVEWWKLQELKNPMWNEKNGKKTDEIHWSTHVAIGELEANYRRVYISYIEEKMNKK